MGSLTVESGSTAALLEQGKFKVLYRYQPPTAASRQTLGNPTQVLQSTDQIKELQTIIRDKDTSRCVYLRQGLSYRAQFCLVTRLW